jgi:hypothetical protein
LTHCPKLTFGRLEERKVPFELTVVLIRLYKNVIAKFRNTKCWSEELNCNIGVKQGCPLSPTLFGIYIDKLEGCLEEVSCVSPTLAGIIIILLCVDDIVLMVRSPCDLDKQLKNFKEFFSSTIMPINTNKTKVMIIKSKKDHLN